VTDTTWYRRPDPGGRWPSSDDPESAGGAGGEGDGNGPPRPDRDDRGHRPMFGASGLVAGPNRRTGAALIVMAVAFDVAAHGRVDGLATAAFFVAVVGALLASGRVRTRSAAAVALLVVPFAALLAWRESMWLVPCNAVVAVLLLCLAASYASGGRVAQMSLSDVAIRAARGVLSMLVAPAFLLGAAAALLPVADANRKRRMIAIARGLGMAVPIVFGLGVLLASADPVFASMLRLPVDPASIGSHLLFLALGLFLASALLVEASSHPFGDLAVDAHPLGTTETSVVLGGLVLLYGLFSGSQVVAARGGADKVLSTAGLTYADYAREGFFQLLAVAAITLAILLGMRTLTKPASDGARLVLVILGETAIALTLAIVGVAINRLGLYDQAYGLTMLRLACVAVAWWLGAVFVLVGVAYAGVGRRQRWIAAAIAGSFLMALFVFNVIDPESIVVRRNVDHAIETGRFDAPYVGQLSDDAVPALVAALPRLEAGDRTIVRARLCQRTSRSQPPPERTGLSWNRSAQLAAEARAEVCGR